jgi:hypothetical protein
LTVPYGLTLVTVRLIHPLGLTPSQSVGPVRSSPFTLRLTLSGSVQTTACECISMAQKLWKIGAITAHVGTRALSPSNRASYTTSLSNTSRMAAALYLKWNGRATLKVGEQFLNKTSTQAMLCPQILPGLLPQRGPQHRPAQLHLHRQLPGHRPSRQRRPSLIRQHARPPSR